METKPNLDIAQTFETVQYEPVFKSHKPSTFRVGQSVLKGGRNRRRTSHLEFITGGETGDTDTTTVDQTKYLHDHKMPFSPTQRSIIKKHKTQCTETSDINVEMNLKKIS